MIKNLYVLLFLFSSSLFFRLQAQEAKYTLFFEKVYLHTDRELYVSGEDIWYKAYLINAQSGVLTNSSRSLYVELISSQDTIVARQMVRLQDGTGKGDFKLSDSLPGGAYRLRAYTNWMRNFKDNFVFEKNISIIHSDAASPKPGSVITGTQVGANESFSAVPKRNLPSINFYPEGGSLIEGLNSRVAFKITGTDGRGLQANGFIIGTAGDTITSFLSNSMGMGSFMLQPASNQSYMAIGTINNARAFRADLPVALLNGFSFRVQEKDSLLNVYIQASENFRKENMNHNLLLTVKHAGKLIVASEILMSSEQIFIRISKEGLPAGINVITLYDAMKRPQCERLVFIEGEKVHLTIIKDKSSYRSKEKVNLAIKAIDAKGLPVKANLSLSVTDKAVVPENEITIQTSLLLQSELKGRIQQPKSYFDEENPDRKLQLELLLLTQGWRDFLWKRLADSAVRISYAPEQGISIKGRVYESRKKPLSGVNISLRIPKSKENQFSSSRTDSSGRYFIDDLEFYGNQTIMLNSLNDKAKPWGTISLDSLYELPLSIKKSGIPNIKTEDSLSSVLPLLHRIASYKLSNPIALKEVNITERKVVPLLEGTATDFGYPVENFRIEASDYDYQDLRHYLLTRSAYSTQAPNDSLNWLMFIGEKGAVPAVIFVNGLQLPIYDGDDVQMKNDIYQQYFSMPMNLISSVQVKKIITLDFGSPDSSIGYLLYITTKPGALDRREPSRLSLPVQGYYESRVFYSPVYESKEGKVDSRPTIFWKSDIVTDQNGEAHISYYNSSLCEQMRFQLEGISVSGVVINYDTD